MHPFQAEIRSKLLGKRHSKKYATLKMFFLHHIVETVLHEQDFSVKVLLTVMWKMQAIRMAHLIPSRQRDAISGSSQSCNPTLNAARKGVQAIWGEKKRKTLKLSVIISKINLM